MPRDDAVLVIGNSDFEDVLCQVDGDDLRVHVGLLLLLVHSVVKNRMLAQCDAEKEREESISSLQLTVNPLRGLSAAELGR